MPNKIIYQYLSNTEHTSIVEFPLVISLVCLGFKFLAIDKNPKTPQQVQFVFSKTQELETTIANYWEGTLQVEPKLFWNISREIKSRIRFDSGYATQ